MYHVKKEFNTKTQMYRKLYETLNNILSITDENITTLANASSIINYFLDAINWVGFYLFDKKETLYLGPFQGQAACTKIKLGKGVCGTSAQQRNTIIVDDVNQFSGHIACSSETQSEIVVPIIIKHELYGVLDIDSPQLSRFDDEDKQHLEEITHLIASKL
ncbi:MAG: GAF domain-containing protein, partial [Bacteroidales bacterium]